MPESSDFVEGYNRALAEWERANDANEWPELHNPFPMGTEAYRGYEEAVYDFTQK